MAETELEDVKERVAILEVENDVLKEGLVEIFLLLWSNTNLWATYRRQRCG